MCRALSGFWTRHGIAAVRNLGASAAALLIGLAAAHQHLEHEAQIRQLERDELGATKTARFWRGGIVIHPSAPVGGSVRGRR